METLGEYLKKIRKENHQLSLRELSRRVGISHSYLSQIENGIAKKPKIYILRALAQELNIDYHVLMYKAGYAKKEKDRKSYIKESRKSINMKPFDNLNQPIDLDQILLDEEKEVYFHNHSMRTLELDFLYDLLKELFESNKPISEETLNRVLAIVKILLK